MLGCMGRLAGVSWHCNAAMESYGHTPAMAVDSLTLGSGGWHHGPPQPGSQKSILAHLLLAGCFPMVRGLWGAQPFSKGPPGLAPSLP